MKSLFRPLMAVASLSLFPAAAFAQAATMPKFMVVDMVKLLDEHPNTAEQNAKLTAEQESATAELEKIQKEVNDLAEAYKAQDQESKNPILNESARAKAANDAKETYAKLQARNAEGISYRDNFTAAMQKRIQNYRDLMFEELNKLATEVAKKKSGGAPFFLQDKSAISALGTLVVIYSDPAADITDEVLAEINRNRPVTPVTAPPATPGAPAKK
jgi:Skp family chaperone for outer membrane proteins